MLRRANKQLRLFGERTPSAAKRDMRLLLGARLPVDCHGLANMYLDWRYSEGLSLQGWVTILDTLMDSSMSAKDYAYSFKVSLEHKLLMPVALRAPEGWDYAVPFNPYM